MKPDGSTQASPGREVTHSYQQMKQAARNGSNNQSIRWKRVSYIKSTTVSLKSNEKGVVEPAPDQPNGELYIPHKAVVKKEAERTKLRIVYDSLAREDNTKPSLNYCLHPGPSLQNQ